MGAEDSLLDINRLSRQIAYAGIGESKNCEGLATVDNFCEFGLGEHAVKLAEIGVLLEDKCDVVR